jgi:hypothetical protein
MNTHDSNRVNMIRATKSYCENNPTPTAGIPAFGVALTSVTTKLLLIDQLDQIASGTTSGVTLDTNNIRLSMAALGFKCGSAVAAYASSVGNNTLLAKVNYVESDFVRMKKEDIDDICQTIHDEANANIAAAGTFGYAATDVTDLQTTVDLYRTSVQNPRQAIISRTSAISQISDLISEVTKNLLKNQMDRMVNTLKLTNPVFVNEYFSARQIIDLGTTTAKLRGTVSDNGGNPLSGAAITMSRTSDGVVVYSTTSGADGKYTISPIDADNYDITVTKTGFQQQQETNVHISAGQEINRDYTMIPV